MRVNSAKIQSAAGLMPVPAGRSLIEVSVLRVPKENKLRDVGGDLVGMDACECLGDGRIDRRNGQLPLRAWGCLGQQGWAAEREAECK